MSLRGAGGRTRGDLHLHWEDDELVLVGGVGFDPDESRVVVHVPGREAGSHHPLRLERRNLLENRKTTAGSYRYHTASKVQRGRGDLPITSQFLPADLWEALDEDLRHWSTSPPP